MKIFFTICALFLLLAFGGSILMVFEGEILLGFFTLCSCIFLSKFLILGYKKNKEFDEQWEKKEQQKKIDAARKQMEIAQINQSAKDGKWEFPSEKFYCMCRASQVTTLNNEFSIQKAAKLAEQVIKETAPEIDLANCGEYFKKESLEGFLKKGEILARAAEEKRILAQKQPRNANPNIPETTFIQRATELSCLSGSDKRVKMLTNLVADYKARIKAMCEGEQALRQLGMIYASQQKKETSWGVMGGIAEGIAGPAAGVIAASNTIANNRKIQQYNESVRKASMDIMSGIPSISEDRYKLEMELGKIEQKLDEAKYKVVLSEPIADKIWQNIKVGKAVVKKNPSGVLSVSVPVSVKEPFALNVPDNVRMVIDGTIRGAVWFEDRFLSTIYFPLPMYGIASNMTVEVTLDGMCGVSVEYDGEYTVKIADSQNLWIMEA